MCSADALAAMWLKLTLLNWQLPELGGERCHLCVCGCSGWWRTLNPKFLSKSGWLRFRGRNFVPLKRKKIINLTTQSDIFLHTEIQGRKYQEETAVEFGNYKSSCQLLVPGKRQCVFVGSTCISIISEEFGKLTIKHIVLLWLCRL